MTKPMLAVILFLANCLVWGVTIEALMRPAFPAYVNVQSVFKPKPTWI